MDLEKRRIAKDAATEADEMFDDNVPMNNKQAVVTPAGQPNNKTVQNTNPKKTPSKTPSALPPAGTRRRARGARCARRLAEEASRE